MLRTGTILSKISQIIQWTYIFFFVLMIFGYVGLVLVWSILGAILNPTAYLYYASAATTLITFIGVKRAQLLALRQKGWKQIMIRIERKAQETIEKGLRALLKKTGVSESMSKAIETGVNAAMEGDLKRL